MTVLPHSPREVEISDTCGLLYKPWWEKGLFFSCLGCGRCCRGEPGSVWVNDSEIAEMALNLGMEAPDFRKLYIRKGRDRLRLRERVNGDCVMFEAQSAKCAVYGSRPVQCRLFPFWPSILRSRDNWNEYAAVCPGMDQGRHWSYFEISSFLEQNPFADL